MNYFNPVFHKESMLRVRTSKFATIVFLYNLVLSVIGLSTFYLTFHEDFIESLDYQNIVVLYVVLCVCQFGVVLFQIPAFTGGAISGERERQTLDILLTTKMKPIDIVVGKLMSSISMVILLSISALPIMALLFSIGGIALVDLFQFEIVIIIAAIQVGAFGMLISTAIKKSVVATSISYAGTIGICGFSFVVNIIFIIMDTMRQNAYYQKYGTSGKIGNFPLFSALWILYLFNPVASVVDILSKQVLGENPMWDMIGNGTPIPTIIRNYWFWFASFAQLASAAFFLILAARILNPLNEKRRGKHGRKNKKISK